MRKFAFSFVFVIAVSLAVAAQGNDVALVAGAKFTPSVSSTGSTTVNKSFAIEGSFAFQLKNLGLALLQVEIPVMVAPNSTVKSSNLFASKSYNSLYFTPGFRLRFASSASVSPWVAVGGGLARFGPSTTSQVGGTTAASATVKGTLDVGGGLDFKVPVVPITFRVEAREYYSGAPNLNLPSLSLHNNIFAGAGFVARF